ncbi:MAG: hypothetical protein IJJ33_14690 [Victivallales bacterium]|nr:hypothetical protein [Victivallales bacterium]
MKKKVFMWTLLAALALAATCLWHSYISDPLSSFKEAKMETVENQADIQAFMAEVLDAIKTNDRRALYEFFGSGDAMAFNRNYLNRFFKEQDFCPAEVTEYRKFTRSANNEVFYEATVTSARRNRRYVFTIEGGGGHFRVSSLMENQQ